MKRGAIIFGIVLLSGWFFVANLIKEDKQLLIVSFEPTRTLYQDLGDMWSKQWLEKEKAKVEVIASHGGSGKQARSVLQGLEGDVVSLGLAFDIDRIAKAGLIAENWSERSQNNGVPFYSTICFVVRKDNPKQIKDWDDLVKKDVSLIMPNPKSSGGARWNYLAAFSYANHENMTDREQKEFLSKIYNNVAVLDAGARASTTTFAERELGDVLVTWEAEALMMLETFPENEFEMIIPSVSVKAETPVSFVDTVVEEKGTKEEAQSFVNFLYTEKAQEVIAFHHFRPVNEKVAKKHSENFPKLPVLYDINQWGGWNTFNEIHFADGGQFDAITSRK
ncbi:MAG: sulfate ABC transporter substrate-binding protein [Bacilli bacterium]